MRLSALALQATLVVGVTATVGYPEFRQPARPIALWHTGGPLTPRPDLVAADQRLAYGIARASTPAGAAAAGPAGAPPAVAADRLSSREQAAVRRTSAISGRARTILNQPVPFARLALRNVRTGRVEATTQADNDGRFDFGVFSAGNYVVEMLAADGSVIASSEMLGSGPSAAITVRVSGNATPRALFGAPGLVAGTTTGTATGTTSGTGAVNPFVASTASEPLGRAAAAGMQQTDLPGEEASPRN